MISITKFFEKKSISLIFALIFLAVFNLTAYGAGELDSTFTGSAFGKFNGDVNVVKIQPDGKILVGGFFTDANGFAASGIARFNADGTTDTSFKSLDFYGTFGFGYRVFAITLQTDGKILVGGNFAGTDGVVKPGVRRLNADGSLDTSFNIFEIPLNSTVYDIEIQPDNKILVGGYVIGIFRLNSDGTFDNTFTQSQSGNESFGVKDIEIQTDGKIVIGGGGSSVGLLDRVTSTGADDSSFSSSGIGGGQVEELKVRPDGKILIGGTFSSVNTYPNHGIALLNSDGLPDLTFNQAGSGAAGWVNDIFLRPDGKILIGGRFTGYNDVSRIRIAQLNADGTLDTSVQFNTNTNFKGASAVKLLPDGKFLVGFGDTLSLLSEEKKSLVKFNADGTQDTTFAPLINRSGAIYKTLQQPDGKFLAAGEFLYADGVKRNSLARYNSDGSLDTSFVPFFNNVTPIPIILSLALQPDGKVLVGLGGRVRRLNTDGTEDTSFVAADTGTIYDIAVLPNGQILMAGDFGGSFGGFIRRLNANGAFDSTFAFAQPNGAVYKILVLPDGKILIGGAFIQIGNLGHLRIARLNAADGSPDNTYAPTATGAIYELELQADGKVILGGAFTALNGSGNQVSIGRLNADGTLDTGFVQSTNGWVHAIKIQSDGKILIGGTMSAVQGAPHNGIARLNANGSIDTAFNTFANTTVQDINLQPDGKILLGGAFSKINRLSAVRIARLLNTIAPARAFFDYDGDGRADVSVFRPSTNRWYVFKSSDATVSETTFGISGDIVSPADYDGDGKTDIGIYRASSGDWWYLSSVDSAQKSVHWGASGDIPRPSDFDGDGKADYIVFRPSNNVWYRFGSTGATSITPFGLAGDKPVTGDFDGDGKSDLAIYRPSNGNWWYLSSVDNSQKAVQWGISTDVPAAADFDGDGKTDFAVYRPSTGVWYIINSNNGSFTIFQFGIAEDKPVAADYDGDGKADVAVFRPSTGVWYQQKTTAGFAAQQFGVSTDTPTENAFVP